MDRLRAIFEWFTSRKYLSLFVIFLIIGAIYATRFYIHANSGKLSDPIRRGDIIDAVYGIGTVTAYKRLSLNPLVGGTVEKTFVVEGDLVKKGSPLLQAENGVIYRAPFDGIVNYFPYKTGENTYSTTPMLILTDISDRYIVVNMEQQGALRVKTGQAAKISFDSLRESVFDGKVSSVYSYAGNFLARIDSINLPEAVLPDMTCDVAIIIKVHKDALLIPIAAFENGSVWVKRGAQIPRETPVQLGVNDGTWAEVLNGDLKVDDRVLIRKQVTP